MGFWEQFWPQLIATMIGAGIGVWGALWINRKQETKQQQKEKQEEKRRKDKILVSLKDELEDNLKGLEGWDESDYEKGALSARLKTVLWKAFSEGGELQWIKDPNLLFFLSEAYTSIKAVQDLSEKYFQLAIFKSPPARHNLLVKVEKDLTKNVRYAQSVLAGVFDYLEAYIQFEADIDEKESYLRKTLKDAKESKFNLDWNI